MLAKSKKILTCAFWALIILFANGCMWHTRDVTVETRFAVTKKPAPGSLLCRIPHKATWPAPPTFEFTSNDGIFDIKLINNFIDCSFTPPGCGDPEYPIVTSYGFSINLGNKECQNWENKKKIRLEDDGATKLFNVVSPARLS